MASTHLERTAGSTGNRRTWTWSSWVRRAAVPGTADAKGGLFATKTDANNRLDFGIDANHKFFFKENLSGSTNIDFTSTQTFSDPGAYYHIVLAVDTTQSTSSNRVKVYVNGSQITEWADSTYPSENYDTLMNVSGRTYYIGSTDGSSNYWNGLMSHIHFCDGTALAPTIFGSTDSSTGQWSINTSPSFTPGTNGFTVLKDGSTITDQSANSNNFSLGGGTLTNTEDCPDNVFATLNPLDNYYTIHTFSNANTTVTSPSTGYSGVIGGLGANSGKYYFEFKPISKTGDADEYVVGIAAQSVVSINQPHYKMATGYMYTGVNGNKINNDTSSSYGNTFTAGDIVGVAMDLDNLKLYFSKNGTWQTSGDPTSGSTGTGAAFTLTAPSETEIGYYLPCCAFVSNSAGATMSFNFGNGFFQTSAISSEGTNASGIGKFEYDVPAGYTALSTKGLNE